MQDISFTLHFLLSGQRKSVFVVLLFHGFVEQPVVRAFCSNIPVKMNAPSGISWTVSHCDV